MTGKIKTKTDRGFGFITPDGETKDIFFHSTKLSGVTFDELSDGKDGREATAVTFDVVQGDKGPAAENVSRAE
ncbi:MAG: cold shock domain-containing protein [Patescibacteria group bacterium]